MTVSSATAVGMAAGATATIRNTHGSTPAVSQFWERYPAWNTLLKGTGLAATVSAVVSAWQAPTGEKLEEGAKGGVCGGVAAAAGRAANFGATRGGFSVGASNTLGVIGGAAAGYGCTKIVDSFE